PPEAGGRRTSALLADQLAEATFVPMVVKGPFRLLPMAVSAPITTAAIRAAIRPYSMAVAPDSSLSRRAIRVLNEGMELPRVRLREIPRCPEVAASGLSAREETCLKSPS